MARQFVPEFRGHAGKKKNKNNLSALQTRPCDKPESVAR